MIANSAPLSSGSDDLEHFEYSLNDLDFVATRELSLDEQCEIRRYGDRMVRFGYLGLLVLLVILPLTIQFFPMASSHGISLVVIGLFSFLGAKCLPVGLGLQRRQGTVWTFRNEKTRKVAEYLPESKMIWKESMGGESVSRYHRQKAVKVALRPEVRMQSKLTEQERQEIAETVAAQKLFLFPVEAIAIVSVVILTKLIVADRKDAAFFVGLLALCVLFCHFAQMKRPFVKSLNLASDEIDVDWNGDEYLSTGVLWTHNDLPAIWRYGQPVSRFYPLAKRRAGK